MKNVLKTLSQVASILATVASCVVVTLALGTVDIEKWSWGMFFIFVMAVAWLTHVLIGYDRKEIK